MQGQVVCNHRHVRYSDSSKPRKKMGSERSEKESGPLGILIIAVSKYLLNARHCLTCFVWVILINRATS